MGVCELDERLAAPGMACTFDGSPEKSISVMSVPSRSRNTARRGRGLPGIIHHRATRSRRANASMKLAGGRFGSTSQVAGMPCRGLILRVRKRADARPGSKGDVSFVSPFTMRIRSRRSKMHGFGNSSTNSSRVTVAVPNLPTTTPDATIGNFGRLLQGSSGTEGQGEERDGGCPGARHVENLLGARRGVVRRVLAIEKNHPMFAQGDEHRANGGTPSREQPFSRFE